LELGIRRLARAHVISLRGPAKHLLIEGDCLVDATRAQFRPPKRVGLAYRHLAVHRATLPGRDDGAAGILEGGHPSLVTDVEWRRHHLPARGLHLLGQAIDIIGGNVDRPRGRYLFIDATTSYLPGESVFFTLVQGESVLDLHGRVHHRMASLAVSPPGLIRRHRGSPVWPLRHRRGLLLAKLASYWARRGS